MTGRAIVKGQIHPVGSIIFGCLPALAQEKISPSMEIDKTVHNFGQIILKNGPVSCAFTLKNTGDKPVAIYNVISSCGCTDVKWTKEPIMPGKSGNISVTYTNDEGAYPFDKTLTTYLSDSQKQRNISRSTEATERDIHRSLRSSCS